MRFKLVAQANNTFTFFAMRFKRVAQVKKGFSTYLAVAGLAKGTTYVFSDAIFVSYFVVRWRCMYLILNPVKIFFTFPYVNFHLKI